MAFRIYNPKKEAAKHDPKKLGDVLQRPSLGIILKKAKLIETLNACLTRHLPVRTLSHCQVMNYENSIVVLGIDNATWATRLRYDEAALLQAFQSDPQAPNVLGIRYKVTAN